MLQMSNRLRVWVALLILLILGTVGSSSAQSGADAAVEVEPGIWLVFSLPAELKGSKGFHSTFYDAEKNPVLTVTILGEHPAEFVSRMSVLSISSAVPSESGTKEPYKGYLVNSATELEKWTKAASLQPNYKLEGGAPSSPLSEQTQKAVRDLATLFWKSSGGNTAVGVKPLMEDSAAKLRKLQGTLADQYLLRLVLAQEPGHKYPFGKLSSRKGQIGRHKVLAVRNELPQFTEDIFFLDIMGIGHAFSFRQKAGQSFDLPSMATAVISTATHTHNRPDFGLGSASPKNTPRGLIAVKHSTIWLVALAFFVAIRKRAAEAWEICRCRESLSSRETFRLFNRAFGSLLFLGGFVFYWNAILPTENDLLTSQKLTSSMAAPALGVLVIASMLSTLGARVGCRFSKKGCEWFAAGGYLLGIMLISAMVVGLLGG